MENILEFGTKVKILEGNHKDKLGTIENYYPAGIVAPTSVYMVRFTELQKGIFLPSEIGVLSVQ